MAFRGRKYGNDTINVVHKGCIAPYDTLACLRSSILTTAAGITIVFVVCKIFKYHSYKHKQIQHYAIFYITAVETLVCMVSFIIGNHYPQLELSVNFLKLLQFSVICHLHWSSSARAHHKEDIIQHVINPGLCLYMIYCTAVALMGMVDIGTTWNECLKPYWLMLSAADLAAVQCFALAAVYITYKTAGMTTMASFRSAQKRDLLTVVIAYEISAVFSVLFDALMRFVGTEESGCSGVFGHSQLAYSATELIFNTGKYLIPTWAILVVFQAVEDASNSSDISASLGYSLDGTPTSVRSSIRGIHQYHRMNVPSQILSPDSLLQYASYTGQTANESPSPSNSSSSISSLTNHVEGGGVSNHGIGYTNHVTLNGGPMGGGILVTRDDTRFQHRGLTTISEEGGDVVERSSVRSDNSHHH